MDLTKLKRAVDETALLARLYDETMLKPIKNEKEAKNIKAKLNIIKQQMMKNTREVKIVVEELKSQL